MVLVSVLSANRAFADIDVSKLDNFSDSLCRELTYYIELVTRVYGEETGLAVFQGAVREWRHEFYKQHSRKEISYTFTKTSLMECISKSIKYLDFLSENSELKKFPRELTLALVRNPPCYYLHRGDMATLCLEIDSALQKQRGEKYTRNESVTIINEFLEFSADSNDNRNYYGSAIDIIASSELILPPYRNAVFLFALYDKKPEEALQDLRDFGHQLTTVKKYSPGVSSTVLKAYSRKRHTREEMTAYADALIDGKFHEDYMIPMIEAYGMGTATVYGAETFIRNDSKGIYRTMLRLYVDKRSVAVVAVLHEACAVYPFFNGRWK